jgi:hypothetical protein
MESILAILGIIGGLLSLVAFVSTVVWAVAQVKETTSNLGIKIENLGRSIDQLVEDYDRIDERVMTVNIYDMAQTWNNGATTFAGIKLNVTDTASASGSLLMDLQVGRCGQVKVDKDGTLYLL